MRNFWLYGSAIAVAAVVSSGASELSKPASAADFVFEEIEEGSDIAVLTLYGEIVEGDSDRLISALIQSIHARGYYIDKVNLFSRGGNALEGIKIGRIINKYYLATQAPETWDGDFYCRGYPGNLRQPVSNSQDANCVCASACAVAWLGGIERYGTVGFHRVYSLDPRTVRDTARQWRQALDQELEWYLSDMGVPDFVEDLIDHAGPDDLSWPTPQQYALLIESVDHSNTVYAACQAFNMHIDERTYMFELLDKSASSTLSNSEQRILEQLQTAYHQEMVCREQVRRRELFQAQQELAGAFQ